MKVLLVYGTSEGQTRVIAARVADRLVHKGHQVLTVNAGAWTSAPDPREFDAVLVAASVHMGRYQRAVIHFVREMLAAIEAKPNAFLSVSLAAAGDDAGDIAGLKRCVANFVRETGWTPDHVHHVAGAFRYTAYGFLRRWAMQSIAYLKGAPTDATRDQELTDWDDLARFTDAFDAAAMQRETPGR